KTVGRGEAQGRQCCDRTTAATNGLTRSQPSLTIYPPRPARLASISGRRPADFDATDGLRTQSGIQQPERDRQEFIATQRLRCLRLGGCSLAKSGEVPGRVHTGPYTAVRVGSASNPRTMRSPSDLKYATYSVAVSSSSLTVRGIGNRFDRERSGKCGQHCQ